MQTEENRSPDQVDGKKKVPSVPIGGLRLWLKKPQLNIDFTRPDHRRKFILANLAFVLIIAIALVGAYQGYAYTESSEFCGGVCHPMSPQFTRYHDSSHAHVECVECHIGPGIDFFIKSKINGMHQVWAVLTDSYSKPIKSPVHDLRPARETCETCHTPTSFKDNIVKDILHYDNDIANTPIKSTLILKLGGMETSTGRSLGIHWHISSEVFYIAADEQRQVIQWVGVTQADGTMKEWFSRDLLNVAHKDFVDKAREEGRLRKMDCIDCHNRAAHYIPDPQEAVDYAITKGLISKDIPLIRGKAVEVLTGASYHSRAEAEQAIAGLIDFYKLASTGGSGNAELDAAAKNLDMTKVEAAIVVIQDIEANTNFPDMLLDWKTNPNNENHTPFIGCFRCHDDKHILISSEGAELDSTISVKCNLCHTVPIVGRGTEMLVEAPVIVGRVPDSHADFSWTVKHRDVAGADKQACYECHGQGFCNNGACHNLSHPENMIFVHAEEARNKGGQVCYTCHQNILCTRCHPSGVIINP